MKILKTVSKTLNSFFNNRTIRTSFELIGLIALSEYLPPRVLMITGISYFAYKTSDNILSKLELRKDINFKKLASNSIAAYATYNFEDLISKNYLTLVFTICHCYKMGFIKKEALANLNHSLFVGLSRYFFFNVLYKNSDSIYPLLTAHFMIEYTLKLKKSNLSPEERFDQSLNYSSKESSDKLMTPFIIHIIREGAELLLANESKQIFYEKLNELIAQEAAIKHCEKSEEKYIQ